MAKSRDSATGERRKYKRTTSYLGNDPPIEAFRCFADMAERIQSGRVLSLRSLSDMMDFSETHLEKWLPRFAEKLGMSEHRLVTLPTGKHPFVRLGPAAVPLLRQVKKLLADYSDLVKTNAPLPDQITCGTWQWLVAHVFTKVAPRFTGRKLPQEDRTGLSIYEYDTDAMIEDLCDGRIDVGVGAVEVELAPSVEDRLKPHEAIIAATGELIAVAPRGHPWAVRPRKKTVRFEDLVKEILCVARYNQHRQFRYFRPRGKDPGRLLVADNYLSVYEMVRQAAAMNPAGRLVGVVPRFGVQREDGTEIDTSLEVCSIRGMDNPRTHFAVWTRKDAQHHTEVEAFIHCTIEVMNEIWRGVGAAGS